MQFEFNASVEKSIERQRRKAAAKQQSSRLRGSSGFRNRTVETTARSSQPSLGERLKAAKEAKAAKSKTTATRRSVATPANTEFTGLRKKSSMAVATRKPSKPAYMRATARKKSAVTWRKLAWVIFLVFSVRLVFMERGVIDYYDNQTTLDNKEHEFESIVSENSSLVEEIHLIKSNKSYQRRVVRDHLGVIAKDEYLVVFAKDRNFLSN